MEEELTDYNIYIESEYYNNDYDDVIEEEEEKSQTNILFE